MSINQLDQLKSMTLVVADTGDIEAIEKYRPEDATTNPSLILKAAQLPKYQSLLKQVIEQQAQDQKCTPENVAKIVDHFAVELGISILKIVPGRISTEVDARLSFDIQKMISKAKELIALYEDSGVNRNRVLIKLASTWEGIKAAEILEKEGINCNLTLIFNFTQALASAQANAFLISPFVGRILDWHKKHEQKDHYPADQDPGVLSVKKIYEHFKHYELKTIVMGASFRNIDEIRELAGCDRLTISPQLMSELENNAIELPRQLDEGKQDQVESNALISESEFRWQLNQDPMATEKLAEGIRNFTTDQEKLESMLLAL